MRDVFHTIELQGTVILLLLPQNRLKLLPGNLKEPGPCYLALTCTGLSAQMTSSKDCVYGPLPKQRSGPLEEKKKISAPTRSFCRPFPTTLGSPTVGLFAPLA